MRRQRSTEYKAEHGRREARSFDMSHPHALRHLDFHHGKRNVMRPAGSLVVRKLAIVMGNVSAVIAAETQAELERLPSRHDAQKPRGPQNG